MRPRNWLALHFLFLFGLMSVPYLAAQQGKDEKKDPDKKEFDKKTFFFGGPGGTFGQNRKLVKQFDKDGDKRLNSDERQAAREFLKKERASGKGFGPFGKGPGGKGKGPGSFGFGPGGFVTKQFLESVDADKDGKLTKEELVAGAKTLFAEMDKDKTGTLEEKQIADALGKILPRPQFFPAPVPDAGKADKPAVIVQTFPPGAEGAPQPPGGGGFVIVGPERFVASNLVQRADANKDGKLTLAECLTAAQTLFKEADADKDGKLSEEETSGGISRLFAPPQGFPGGFGPGPFGKRDPAKPGPRVTPAEVKSFGDAPLYEPSVLRTLFLEFENKDWEEELADFKGSDVEVPAVLTVDGKKYPNVGVHFRGMSSYGMTPAGYKRSLNLSLDFVDPKQRLYGHKTLNLLNAAGDSSLLSTALYSHIARQYIPAPKANLVKVVINGESWGVYANVQQFNKDFVAENYGSDKGARWKVAPGGDGGLTYFGDKIEDYKRRYQIKSPDDQKSWKALVNLCRVLNQTPPDKLEEALTPILDIDGVLKFLALDVVLSNSDGYWIRASDYSIYRDPKGKFHIIPHDMNEAFQPAMGFMFGPGVGPKVDFKKDAPKFGKKEFKGDFGPPKGKGGRGMAPGAAGPDPLVGLDDMRKPLRSKLLAVPSLKAKYLEYVRAIAEDDLNWKKLGPVVAQYRTLIEKEVEIDTRKLMTLAAFQQATADAPSRLNPPPPGGEGKPGPGGRSFGMSLRTFADERRNYLLHHPEVKKGGKEAAR
ncbi:MAG: CotH kinase family protein [Gemmataceae bacterium]|nr:CotH kinase family protein [Gemmataceae bacterium]MCI0739216.1 CotH kinase family protein [Gemmataceae bacterium]